MGEDFLSISSWKVELIIATQIRISDRHHLSTVTTASSDIAFSSLFRTGAFIAIDILLERLHYEKTVDVYGVVCGMRRQRNFMVQTEDQYIFIYDAILEAVTDGNTEVLARNLYTHVQHLGVQQQGNRTVYCLI
ncbi:unnamed protein product [Protopolystoma xenopodis]|uniref:Tyrosine-protein phosphatase domain-containing protein n=1 Tax=Protopolystoma xenopodis TaxID=117903 RepID=A0A3S5A8A8_9PLAT|nr:unnamed protein product [Protopolystoma xenopodis]